LSRFENRQALTNHLYQQVQALAQQTSEDVT
jgi:hypothetical protein